MSEISAAATSTVVRASRVFTLSSPLSYAILDRPRPGQAAVLHDEAGIPTLVHFADTEADAQTWLKAHPRRAARVVAVDVPEPRAFTYLQDPGHGWLIVNRAELDSVGMSSADFSRCSYVLGDSFVFEKDRDNAGVLETSRRVRHSLPPSRAPHQRRCPRPSLGLQRRSGSASKLTSGVGRSRKEGREAPPAVRPRWRIPAVNDRSAAPWLGRDTTPELDVSSGPSLRALAVSQIRKDPAFRCRRACRPFRELVPVTTEIGEASPFHWLQQVQLGNRQAVKQSGDSRCNGHGHVRLPWKSRYIIGLNPLYQGLIRSAIGVRVEPAYSALVLTPRQLRAARVLIGWSRKVLSERSGVPIKTTEAFERGTTDPKMSTEHKWRRALERAGVVFIEEDETGGVGVRLRERRKGDSAP